MQGQIFDINLYNDDFFAWHYKHARIYSLVTMKWYIQQYKPKSVIDFGCGIASYLEQAHQGGITNLRGLDIAANKAAKYIPEHIKPFVECADCTFPIKTKKYDCVISFETAEHIEPSRTDVFVRNIVNAVSEKGLILFTAAPPGQDGTGHINCHKKQYWKDQFANTGLVEEADWTITEEIAETWRELGAPDYICNNLIVFEKARF